MSERAESLRTEVRNQLHRLSSDAIVTGKRADVDEVLDTVARSICEHLGITPGVVEAVTARVTTRPDGVTRAELIAAEALATLLEAAGIER